MEEQTGQQAQRTRRKVCIPNSGSRLRGVACRNNFPQIRFTVFKSLTEEVMAGRGVREKPALQRQKRICDALTSHVTIFLCPFLFHICHGHSGYLWQQVEGDCIKGALLFHNHAGS